MNQEQGDYAEARVLGVRLIFSHTHLSSFFLPSSIPSESSEHPSLQNTPSYLPPLTKITIRERSDVSEIQIDKN